MAPAQQQGVCALIESLGKKTLVVLISKMKNDQEGQNLMPRHVDANPENPAVCPVLSLSILIFSSGHRNDKKSRLIFIGKAQSRFVEWLKKVW
jgi:hypothetical protein